MRESDRKVATRSRHDILSDKEDVSDLSPYCRCEEIQVFFTALLYLFITDASIITVS